MAQTIKEIMPQGVISLTADEPLTKAAQIMRDNDVGDVIVLDEGDHLRGIVTDRDITVRAIAEGRDPAATKVGDIASVDVETVSPDDTVDKAAQVMRDRAVRRLPVVEGERVVGVVSIGDLAIDQDPKSALADISAAEGNV